MPWMSDERWPHLSAHYSSKFQHCIAWTWLTAENRIPGGRSGQWTVFTRMCPGFGPDLRPSELNMHLNYITRSYCPADGPPRKHHVTPRHVIPKKVVCKCFTITTHTCTNTLDSAHEKTRSIFELTDYKHDGTPNKLALSIHPADPEIRCIRRFDYYSNK